MFEVLKEKNEIVVSVKLKKRLRHRDPKIFIYVKDALYKARETFPDLHISDLADNNQVASTVRAPHEVTWRFKIKTQKEESIEDSFVQSKKELKVNNKKNKKEQKDKVKQSTEIVENQGEYEKELATDLTSSESSATMEETLEKVQEPTE